MRNDILVEKQNKYLSYDSTNCLKGIFAIFVLLHHLYQYSGLLKNSAIGLAFQALGYLSVGMFFFYTGYGMMVSKNKLGYVKSIGKKRILPLYLFYVFLIILYAIWRLVLHCSVSPMEVLQSLLFGKTIVPLGWYFQVIFVVYLLLWLVFTVAKRDLECISVTGIALVIYCIICNKCGLASTWYESIFCVLLGMIWAAYKDMIDRALNKRKWGAFWVGGLLFSVFLVGTKISPLFNIEIKMISAVFFSAFVTFATYVFPSTIYNNIVIRILGKYSLEIYACQGIFLMLRKDGIIYIDNPYIFIVIVIVGTGIMSIIMKPLYVQINKKVKEL